MMTTRKIKTNQYFYRHKETLEILSRPDWVEAINQGLKASEKGETVKWREKKNVIEAKLINTE